MADRAKRGGIPAREPGGWIAWVCVLLVAVIVAAWVEARTSWYLAIDQFGYLTFARDLVAGRVAHPSILATILGSNLPGEAVDAFGQTYVLGPGGFYSRYAPGFPLLLALVSGIFGEAAVHDVNFVAIGLLLIAFATLVSRLVGSIWLGLAGALLVVLLPTDLLLWSISPLRDVPCLVIVVSLLALLFPTPGRGPAGPARMAFAGFAFGFAISTRVDAVLFAIPVAGLLWIGRPFKTGTVVAGTFALLLGLFPLLAYNQAATGNPLLPTQAMEFESVLSKSSPVPQEPSLLASLFDAPPAYALHHKVGPEKFKRPLQGGGFRLSHFKTTFPGSLRIFQSNLGSLIVLLGLLGALVSLRDRALFLATVPYILAATIFYSFWTRPDSRYLMGALLLFLPLAFRGLQAILGGISMLHDRFPGARAHVPALVLVSAALAYAATVDTGVRSALPWAVLALLGAGVVALPVAALRGGRHAQVVFSICFALSLLVVFSWRTQASWGQRGSFQVAEVEAAREQFESYVPPGSVVVTSYQYGRPAENINYYTSSLAVYLEEMLVWAMKPGKIVWHASWFGADVYLLVTAEEAERWRTNPWMAPRVEFEMVRRIPANEARDFFVASPHHRGIPLVLMRVWIGEKRGPKSSPRVSAEESR